LWVAGGGGAAAADYLQFVREYLQMLSDSDTTGKGAAQHGKV